MRMSTLLRLAAALLAIIVLADQSANALDADDAASRMKKQASATASKKRATDSDKLFVQSRKHSKSIFPPKRFESSRARSHEKATTYESDLLLVKELIDSSKYEQLRLPIDKLVSSFNGMVGLQRLDNSLKLLRFAEILVKVRRVDEARQLYSAVFCTIAGAPSVTSELETEVVAVGKFLLQVDEPEKALEVLNFASSFFEKTDKKPGAGEFRRLVVLAERQRQAPRPLRQSLQTSAPGSENQPFRSEFVALGSKSVSLEGNTRLGSVSSSAERVSRIGDPDGGLAGSFGTLYCRGLVSGNSDFSISGTRPWGPDVPVRSQLSNRSPVSDTPETPPYPLPNALSAPPDAKDIRNDNESSFVTGDYIVSNIQLRDVRKRGTGVLRLFIEDAKKTEGPAFWAVNNSSINSYRFDSRSVPGEFQIWYQGDGDIKLDHNCEFCGIIYAPNARVELGPNNVHFYGAIVARDIYADGNVSLLFDRDLLKIRNWKDKSAFESTTNSIVSSSSASSSRTGMISSPPPTTAEDRIKAIRQQMGLGAGRHSARMDLGSRLKYQDSFEERTKARFEVMKSAYEQAKAKYPHGDVTIKTLSRLAKYHL